MMGAMPAASAVNMLIPARYEVADPFGASFRPMFPAASVTPAQERKQQEVDDTQAKLDAAAQKRALKKAEQDRRQDLVDRVNAMDEQSLRDFAKSTYQQEIDGRVHDMAKLREKVIGFVDQFGFE